MIRMQTSGAAAGFTPSVTHRPRQEAEGGILDHRQGSAAKWPWGPIGGGGGEGGRTIATTVAIATVEENEHNQELGG